jgi:hypothetical protein
MDWGKLRQRKKGECSAFVLPVYVMLGPVNTYLYAQCLLEMDTTASALAPKKKRGKKIGVIYFIVSCTIS